MSTVSGQPYDRLKEIKQFEDSKLGVRGLLDSGITSIPRFFIHPSETLSDLKPTTRLQTYTTIPTIDISDQRSKVVEQVALACRELGFFQIVNHGIALEVVDRIIGAVKGFHEQPAEEKARCYCREMGSVVSFSSNYDLFRSKAACWRDSLLIRTRLPLPELEKIPDICRKEVMEWDGKIKPLGMFLMELLCEGLGLKSEKLEEITCLEGRALVENYYPCWPQPNCTFGNECHIDPGVLTVLLRDHIGGLQVKCGGDRQWVDVQPLPGALVINVFR
ncbi:hypothetical protein P3X46_032879 [Hevea brasiliensis]|uniref:Non-haem dioxygenase N-terminal domain-containing protein n=2 Tax=Hevea brasiliensis TaxID=3981 RepID=A0ABQ9KEP1_HEVBR|nr:hypothetical protein P3X46_032879 [Hevea brasiliensis]